MRIGLRAKAPLHALHGAGEWCKRTKSRMRHEQEEAECHYRMLTRQVCEAGGQSGIDGAWSWWVGALSLRPIVQL